MTSRLGHFLSAAREAGASDLVLSSNAVPWIRVEGALQRLPESQITPDEIESIGLELAAAAEVSTGLDVDFSVQMGDLGRFRVNLPVNQKPALKFFLGHS